MTTPEAPDRPTVPNRPAPDWPTSRDELIAAWLDTSAAVLELSADLTAEQSAAPTPCADWTVHDVLAHLAAIEQELVGGPRPALNRRPGRSLLDDYTESGVAERRGRPLEQVRDEFAAARSARHAALTEHPPADPRAIPPHTPGGQPWNWRRVLTNRVVDTWVHELDLRVGLGAPLRWQTPAAAVFVRFAADQLSRAFAAAAAPQDALPVPVTVAVTGPDGGVEIELVAQLPGRIVAGIGAPDAVVRFDTDLPGLVALTTGRPVLGGRIERQGTLADAIAARLLVVA